MRRLRGLIARADGSTVAGVVGFGETIESVEGGGGADVPDYLMPGFIDLQVNGRDVIDVMDAGRRAVGAFRRDCARRHDGVVADRDHFATCTP